MNKFSTRPSREKMLHQLHRGNLHKHRSRVDSALWMCTAMRYLSLMPTRFRNILIVIPVWSTFSLFSSTNLSYWSVTGKKIGEGDSFQQRRLLLEALFSQLVRVPWLVNFSRLYLTLRPAKFKSLFDLFEMKSSPTNLIFSVVTVKLRNLIFLSDLWPARFAFGP